MTWTYSGDPQQSEKDAIRFALGDTDPDDELLQDEEIAYLLDGAVDQRQAVIAGARAISARFSRKASKSVGDLRIDYTERAEHYAKMVTKLIAETTGGIESVPSGMDDGSDERLSTFSIGMHDRDGYTPPMDVSSKYIGE